MRALYQPKKGRDLFDLYYANRRSKLDFDKIFHCYQEYMKFTVDKPPTAKQFLINLKEKETSSLFNGDLEGLLRTGIEYNEKEAFEWFGKRLEVFGN